VVGESGSGKTTLGHCVTRLVAPDAGTIRWRGQDFLALKGRELRAARRHVQMVFQDPGGSFNPRHRVGPIIAEAPQRYGLSRAEAEARARGMLYQVGLGAAAFQRFPHEFSGGQRQRIGIARALALEPELIVADEPVSALDVSIQAEILALLAELRRRFGLTMLFITHDLRVARQLCDRIAVMRAGAIVELGEAQAIFSRPRHPYTQALLDAVPGASWAPLLRASNVNAEEEGAVATS